VNNIIIIENTEGSNQEWTIQRHWQHWELLLRFTVTDYPFDMLKLFKLLKRY